MRRLVAYVHIGGQVFAPGDDVPADLAARITNPAAWEGEEPAPAESPAPGDKAPMPPRSGPGSGVKAWAAYAADSGVAVPDGSGRDDIIAALERAGVPTGQER